MCWSAILPHPTIATFNIRMSLRDNRAIVAHWLVLRFAANCPRNASIASFIETSGRHSRRCRIFALEKRFPFHSAEQRRRLKAGGSCPSDHSEYFSHTQLKACAIPYGTRIERNFPLAALYAAKNSLLVSNSSSTTLNTSPSMPDFRPARTIASAQLSTNVKGS